MFRIRRDQLEPEHGDVAGGFVISRLQVEAGFCGSLLIENVCLLPCGEGGFALAGGAQEQGISAQGVGQIQSFGFGMTAVEQQCFFVVCGGWGEVAVFALDVCDVADGVRLRLEHVESAVEIGGLAGICKGGGDIALVALDLAQGAQRFGKVGSWGFGIPRLVDCLGESDFRVRQAMFAACLVAGGDQRLGI